MGGASSCKGAPGYEYRCNTECKEQQEERALAPQMEKVDEDEDALIVASPNGSWVVESTAPAYNTRACSRPLMITQDLSMQC